MTRLKGFIENCRWALPTARPFSCKDQSQAALPSPCVLLQGLLSASHPQTEQFSFYYYWRLWLFFNFLLFLAGMSSICFSVIDSCSHFSPSAFRRALCSAELCQSLQPWSSAFAAAASAWLPGPARGIPANARASSLLSLVGPAHAMNRTGAWWDFFIRFYSTVSCSCAALSLRVGKWWVCAWGRLTCLQVSLTQDEFLSLQPAHLQQVTPVPQGGLLHLLLALVRSLIWVKEPSRHQRKCLLAPASLVTFLWTELSFISVLLLL